MKTLLIILGVLVLLALIPLGAHVRYDSEGPWVALVIGPIKIRLIPKKPKKPKKPQKAKNKKTKSRKRNRAKRRKRRKKSRKSRRRSSRSAA